MAPGRMMGVRPPQYGPPRSVSWPVGPAVFEFQRPHSSRLRSLGLRLSTRRNRIALVLGPGLAALLIVTALCRSYTERRLDAKWQRVSPVMDELQALQGNIRMFRPWYGESADAVEALAALTEAFPEDGRVTVRTVQYKTEGLVSCAGTARTQKDLMDVLDRLRRMPGVSEIGNDGFRGEPPILFDFDFTWRKGRHE